MAEAFPIVRGVYLLTLRWDRLESFRIGTRPGLLGGWPAGYRALESAVTEATRALREIPHGQLSERPEKLRELVPPRLGDREGFIDAFCAQESEHAVVVVTRAIFPFRWWPFGGWVVFTAFRSEPSRAEPLSESELDERW